MTWEELLTDLEDRFAAAQAIALAGEIDERREAALAQLQLSDRLRPMVGTSDSIVLGMSAHGVRRGAVRALGVDWVLLQEPAGECVVAVRHVLWAEGFTAASEAAPVSVSAAAMDFRYALGVFVRDRCPVQILTADGADCYGTLDAVGADHVVLALHDRGEQRRADAVRAVRAIALSAIVAVARS